MPTPPKTNNHELPLIPTLDPDYSDIWGGILNDSGWSVLDEKLIARDTLANIDNYTPYDGAIFWADDSGSQIYRGDGTSWTIASVGFDHIGAETASVNTAPTDATDVVRKTELDNFDGGGGGGGGVTYIQDTEPAGSDGEIWAIPGYDSTSITGQRWKYSGSQSKAVAYDGEYVYHGDGQYADYHLSARDPQTGDLVWGRNAHSGTYIKDLLVYKNYIITISHSGVVICGDLNNEGSEIWRHTKHDGYGKGVSMTGDGFDRDIVMSLDLSGELYFVELSTGDDNPYREVNTSTGVADPQSETSYIYPVQELVLMLVGGEEGQIEAYNEWSSLKWTNTSAVSSGSYVWDLDVNSSGIYAAGQDYTVSHIDPDGNTVWTHNHHTDQVRAIYATDNAVYSIDGNETLVISDPQTGEKISSYGVNAVNGASSLYANEDLLVYTDEGDTVHAEAFENIVSLKVNTGGTWSSVQ